MKVCGNPEPSQSIGIIFPAIFAYILSLRDVLLTLHQQKKLRLTEGLYKAQHLQSITNF